MTSGGWAGQGDDPSEHDAWRPTRPVRVYGVLDYARDEFRDDPLTLTQVLRGLLLFALGLLFVVLFLSTGEYPS